MKNYLLSGVLGAAVLAGSALGWEIPTARYNERPGLGNVNRVPNANARNLEGLANRNSFSMQSNPILPYEEAREIVSAYQNNLPFQNLKVYTPSQSFKLDTTGPLNSAAYGLKAIQDVMCQVPQCAKRLDIILGEADAQKPGARENQLSRDDNLHGLMSFGYGYMFVDMREVKNLDRRFNEQRLYDVSVTFGRPAFEMIKRRENCVGFLDLIADAGIGFLATGFNPIGAAIGGGVNVIQAGENYVKGRVAPRENLLIKDGIYTGVPVLVGDTLSLLHAAKDGSNSLILVPYSIRTPVKAGCENECQAGFQQFNGVGAVIGKNFYDVRYGDADRDGCIDTTCFRTDQKGYNWLCKTLNKALWGLMYFGIKEKVVERCDHGGGRRGGYAEDHASGGGRGGGYGENHGSSGSRTNGTGEDHGGSRGSGEY